MIIPQNIELKIINSIESLFLSSEPTINEDTAYIITDTDSRCLIMFLFIG